jgi:hypothetical protein
MNIDIERLRKELIDYYGTGAMSGMPAMLEEVRRVEHMSDEEVLRAAKKEGMIRPTKEFDR